MYIIRSKESGKLYATRNRSVVMKITGLAEGTMNRYLSTEKVKIYEMKKWTIQRTLIIKGSDIETMDVTALEAEELKTHVTTREKK